MKKIILMIGIFLMSFILIPNVHASTATISVTTNRNTVIVGNTVTATVTISSSSKFAGWDFVIGYDTSVLELRSGDTHVIGYDESLDMSGKTRVTYSYTFKAKKSGNTTISISSVSVADWNQNKFSVTKRSATVRCMTQAEIEATYSKNNNLSSLGIDGYQLLPNFSPDVTEYSVELAPNTEKVNITATKADSLASILGTGEIEVSEGLNVIKIDVTAQNGNIKSYIINATVKELDPIEVEVNGKKYNVVRNKKALTFQNPLFTETTTLINATEVPAFYNENSKITLVGLKDNEGTIKYFIIDNDKFTEYRELSLNNVQIFIKSTDLVPFNHFKTNISINDIEYIAYKVKDTSRFALIYGVNLANGNEGFYCYDNYENTLQRFDIETNDIIEKNNKKASLLLYVFIGSTSCLFILLIVSLVSKKNKKSKPKVTNETKKQKKLEETKEFKLGHTHDLKEELEMAKKQLIETDEEDEETEEEKDIFDEMEEQNNKENESLDKLNDDENDKKEEGE